MHPAESAPEAIRQDEPIRRKFRDGRSAAKEPLLRAATELFGELGFDNTSVQEIVERAELTKGAFYHWFESKEDLLRLIHDRFIDWELAQARAVLAEGLPPHETLTRLIAATLAGNDRHKAEIAVFIRERRHLSNATFAAVLEKRDQLEAIIVGVLDDGVRTGEFRPVPSTKVLAFGILGMCAWATEWYQPDGPMSIGDVASMYADILVNGVATTRAGASTANGRQRARATSRGR